MFDLLVSLGGKLHIKNKQGLTPLTLAAKLAIKDVRILLPQSSIKILENLTLLSPLWN